MAARCGRKGARGATGVAAAAAGAVYYRLATPSGKRAGPAV